MVIAVPMSLDGGAGDVARQRNLEQGREALKDARAFRADAAQVTSLGEQLAQAGQLAADATEDDKLRAAQKMVDDQIAQMEAQLKTLRPARPVNPSSGSSVEPSRLWFLRLRLCSLRSRQCSDRWLGWSDFTQSWAQ